MPHAIGWQQAWEQAAADFYLRQPPARHFATDAQDGSSARLILPILLGLLEDIPGPVALVDVGAGDGALVTDLLALAGDGAAGRIQAMCIDLRERPEHLDPEIGWLRADARELELPSFDGILIAHELLDDLPCPWVELDADGVRRAVLVEDSGRSELGPAPAGRTELGPALADRTACRRLGIEAAAIDAWLDRWWPTRQPFARCEPGLTRDRAWHRLTAMLGTGHAIAIDYGHVRQDRLAGTWDGGTICGYRSGRVVSPTPDGSCNITAHVSMDAVAAAAVRATGSLLQRLHGDFWLLAQSFGLAGSPPRSAATMPR